MPVTVTIEPEGEQHKLVIGDDAEESVSGLLTSAEVWAAAKALDTYVKAGPDGALLVRVTLDEP